jgi:hypothetical protein
MLLILTISILKHPNNALCASQQLKKEITGYLF